MHVAVRHLLLGSYRVTMTSGGWLIQATVGSLGGVGGRRNPFGVELVGGAEDVGPFGLKIVVPAVVDVGGGVEAEGAVVVDVVVVPEEGVGEGLGVGQAAEAVGEAGAVLERLELGFAVGVVVRLAGPGMAAGHAEIGEELDHRLEVMDVLRSAWTMSWSRSIPCSVRLWAMRSRAQVPTSRGATSQPTT